MTNNDRKETYRLGGWIAREDWPLWLILAASFVVAAVLCPTLPERIPMHWNIRGEVDRWGGRGSAFLLLAVDAGLYLMFLVLPLLDPRRENYPKFQSTYRILRWLMVVFMTAMWGFTMAAARGARIEMGMVVPAMTSILFIIFGNLMGRIRFNWFVGIKTPWALANEEAWRLTHRVGGRAWVLGGVVGLLGSLLLGREAAFLVMTAAIGAASVFSVAYSYVAWRKTANR